MPIIEYIITIIIAYLLGSIPTSVWIGKIFYGKDVRDYGSGNAGASNTFRVLGKKAGIPVLIFDIFKGWAAIQLARFTSLYLPGTQTPDYINFELMLGIAALLGHIFPIYVKFKGGKGVATLLGIVIALEPRAAIIAITIFLVSLFTTRYVSLSSMIAGLTFPVLIIVVFKITIIPLVVFSMTIAILLLFTHQKNIERLLAKKENKANIKLKIKTKKRA